MRSQRETVKIGSGLKLFRADPELFRAARRRAYANLL